MAKQFSRVARQVVKLGRPRGKIAVTRRAPRSLRVVSLPTRP